MNPGTYNEMERRILENNLQLTNREIAHILDKTEAQIRNYLHRAGLTRTAEQLDQIRARIAANQTGENNPNWRGGISKDNYHYKKLQVERYPEKVMAREQVYKAKKSGKLIPEPCEICGSEDIVQAHHRDYSKPLDVMWLCPNHHRKIESENGLFSSKISESDY